LAYIEWFSKFTGSPEPHSKMYRVKRTLNIRERQASIVPVSLIRRSCHLLPKWGQAVPREWTSDNVLDKCSVFLLNSFKDMHTYFNVC
ncbi:hypothetical protein BJ138DRAFT_1018599, partial [Hygrophoropsis aurantiaca]